MVNGEVIDLRPRTAEERAVPGHVIVTDRDEAQRRIDSDHRLPIPEVIARVGIRVGVPPHPVAPNLVPQLPGLHAERLGMTVLRAQRSILGRRGAVDVLDPRRGFIGGRTATLDVDDEMRLGAEVLAEADELVSAEVARFALVRPGQVDPLGPLVARPDAPHPVIVLRDVPAGPADEARAERLDPLEHVGPHLVHGIPGDQGYLIDPHTPVAIEEDREFGERIARRRPQGEAILLPAAVRCNAADIRRRVRFPASAVPLERGGHMPGEVPRAQPQRAVVLDPGADRHSTLVDAPTLSVLHWQIDPQRMIDL